MKAVLISINKPHTDNIFTHKKKKVEWRKKPLPLTTHYCYETKNKGGCGKVIGQFDVVSNLEFDPLKHHFYSSEFIEDGCVPIEDLIEYANGDVIYGNILENIQEYDKPKELWEFKTKCKEYGSDNPNCTECHYYIDGMCYEYDESDCGCSGRKPITRPPQSWCYVESEAVEVRHGKWEFINQAVGYLEPPYGDTAKCSLCGFVIDVSEMGYKYCPDCGAKMDGERREK